ncbi:hypothetical protein FOZ62_030663 [Perkinsus olseni]|uniref:Uncharacterized protein n=1 Tax=Perkinsus olseni TaxID=32597 RepID=A0A7J6RJ95_PEROL|nr:hypothetical protein FOZ62_030663 [Perkinsus olseni]
MRPQEVPTCDVQRNSSFAESSHCGPHSRGVLGLEGLLELSKTGRVKYAATWRHVSAIRASTAEKKSGEYYAELAPGRYFIP